MKRLGFSMVELLIVVAILALLAAASVPNLLEAQMRAKISRAEADLRSLATALESYRVDHNHYPMDGAILLSGRRIYPSQNPSDAVNRHKFVGPCLTTPLAYLTSRPMDPFINSWNNEEEACYFYANLQQAQAWLQSNMGMVPPLILSRIENFGPWMMHSAGPDGDRTDIGSAAGPNLILGIYDPSNGTVSNGDIARSQKRPSWR